jgi:hypothetical protein
MPAKFAAVVKQLSTFPTKHIIFFISYYYYTTCGLVYAFPVRETISIEKRVPPVSSSPEGMNINRKEMNALTGNKAILSIFRSMDINALTGNAQNHAVQCMDIRLMLEI